MQELYTAVVGHNVLEIPGSTVKNASAPITMRRLDRDGGEVVVDATGLTGGTLTRGSVDSRMAKQEGQECVPS